MGLALILRINYDMGNVRLNKDDNSAYPGMYLPMLDEGEFRKAMKKGREGDIIIPPANMIDSGCLYKIEIAIPGVQTRDFLVQAEKNVISVCVLHNEDDKDRSINFKLHEFNYKCFRKHVILPENIDTERAWAEYKDGILRLYVPKSGIPVQKVHTHIVVY